MACRSIGCAVGISEPSVLCAAPPPHLLRRGFLLSCAESSARVSVDSLAAVAAAFLANSSVRSACSRSAPPAAPSATVDMSANCPVVQSRAARARLLTRHRPQVIDTGLLRQEASRLWIKIARE
eukprot:3495791-Prymnesium_polylepis.1